MPKGRGRHKAIEDAKTTRQKARNLVEKETIIAPSPTDTKADGKQVAKHHSAVVKRGAVEPRHNETVPQKTDCCPESKTDSAEQSSDKNAGANRNNGETGYQNRRAGTCPERDGHRTRRYCGSQLHSGGWGGLPLFLMLLAVIVIGAIAASPFGILFSEENTTLDTVSVAAAIALAYDDFNGQLGGCRFVNNELGIVDTAWFVLSYSQRIGWHLPFGFVWTTQPYHRPSLLYNQQ